jgi:hypothetical protein
MVWIATTGNAGSGGFSSITFSSIPSTFTHLQLRFFVKDNSTSGNVNNYCRFIFNGDGGTNYTNHSIFNNYQTTTVTSLGFANENGMYQGDYPTSQSGVVANAFGVFIIDILDYANTNKYKTTKFLIGSDQNGQGSVRLGSSLWQSTSAVNSITISPINGATAFTQYTRADLYGITSSQVTGA